MDPIIQGKHPAEILMHEILGPDLLVFSKYDTEKFKTEGFALTSAQMNGL